LQLNIKTKCQKATQYKQSVEYSYKILTVTGYKNYLLFVRNSS